MGLMLAAAASAALAQGGADLVLRGGEAPPSGQVREVTIEGVVVGSDVTAPVIVGWDRVREVRGEMSDEAAQFAELADMVWRARARLDRGDIPAAEPLFERLFVTYERRQGPTAAGVCEGLLQCRLRRNAHTLAVGAWLAWLHARNPGDGAHWYQRRSAPEVVDAEFGADETTGLIPDLPPIWLDLPAVQAFATSAGQSEELGTREQDLSALYMHAAAIAAGSDAPMPRVSSGDTGVRLVLDVVLAQGATADERLNGRRAIEARLRTGPTGWQDAWLRTALGRSLLAAETAEDRERGVIELLRVRVMHDRDCPYLAGLALAQAAVAMIDAGDAQGADVLRREFLDRFPGHPAASWDRIMVWPQEGATASAGTRR